MQTRFPFLRPTGLPLLVRAGALLLASALVSLVVADLARDAVAPVLATVQDGGLGAVPFADLLCAGCAVLLSGCWAWCALTGGRLALSVAASALRRHPGGPTPVDLVARPGATPRLVRLVVLAALGVPSLGLVAPAQAATPATGSSAGADGSGTAPAGGRVSRVPLAGGALTGLPLPDRATVAEVEPSAGRQRVGPAGQRPGAAHQHARALEQPGPAVVVVRPGDCLWSLADAWVRGQGREPDRSTLAAAVERLRRLNSGVLGPDPDLVFPGTRLVLPPSAAPSGKERP